MYRKAHFSQVEKPSKRGALEETLILLGVSITSCDTSHYFSIRGLTMNAFSCWIKKFFGKFRCGLDHIAYTK